MTSVDIMMYNTQDAVSLIGEAIKADGWYGYEDGLHTVAVQVTNFTGRIWIEASLSLNPTEQDWFPVKIGRDTDFVQFPLNPLQPTGNYETGGDTLTYGASFRINAVWVRAKMTREYLNMPFETQPELVRNFGFVDKITLVR